MQIAMDRTEPRDIRVPSRPASVNCLYICLLFGPSSFGAGMKSADRPSRGTGRAATADLSAARPKPKLKKALPEVWALIKPHRLLLGWQLPADDRQPGQRPHPPASTKYLIDNVMGKHQMQSAAHHRRHVVGSRPSSRASRRSPSPSYSPRPASASSPSCA